MVWYILLGAARSVGHTRGCEVFVRTACRVMARLNVPPDAVAINDVMLPGLVGMNGANISDDHFYAYRHDFAPMERLQPANMQSGLSTKHEACEKQLILFRGRQKVCSEMACVGLWTCASHLSAYHAEEKVLVS